MDVLWGLFIGSKSIIIPILKCVYFSKKTDNLSSLILSLCTQCSYALFPPCIDCQTTSCHFVYHLASNHVLFLLKGKHLMLSAAFDPRPQNDPQWESNECKGRVWETSVRVLSIRLLGTGVLHGKEACVSKTEESLTTIVISSYNCLLPAPRCPPTLRYTLHILNHFLFGICPISNSTVCEFELLSGNHIQL